MKGSDKINSVLRAAQYLDQKAVGGLRLRTSRHFADMAEEITKLIWMEMLENGGIEPIDIHTVPFLAHAVNQVLLRRIDDCIACSDPSLCDPWAQTGGGAPTLAQRPPVCAEHAERLRREAGPELDLLFKDLETTVSDFIAAHTPPYDRIDASTAGALRQSIDKKVTPYVIRNLASSCCDACVKESSDSKTARDRPPDFPGMPS